MDFLLAPLFSLNTTYLKSDKEVDFSVIFGEIIVSK